MNKISLCNYNIVFKFINQPKNLNVTFEFFELM